MKNNINRAKNKISTALIPLFILSAILGAGVKATTSTPAPSGQYPAWSPDGRRIAFSSDRMESVDIWVVDADWGNLRRLTRDRSTDSWPTWSPDGSKIAFTSHRSGNYDIWVMDANGKNKVQLTTDPAWDMDPAWSPDGKKIAFTSDRSG
ncbi:MAG: TolB family protein, partial [Candidatus Geothermarchaeales archaeon]